MFYFAGTRKPDFRRISDDVYGEYWNRHNGYTMRSKLMEREYIFLNWIAPHSQVVSLGCGNSRLLYELREKKGCTVYGIDIVPMVVEGMRRSGIDASVADVADRNFDLGSIAPVPVDYIVMSELLEHLVYPEALVAKTRGWAKHLVISVPNSAFYRYRLGLLMSGRFCTQWAHHPSEHLRYWSYRDFCDWLAAFDLTLEASQASNGPFLKNVWPNMFGHQMCYLVRT